jgi:hypothetical protein
VQFALKLNCLAPALAAEFTLFFILRCFEMDVLVAEVGTKLEVGAFVADMKAGGMHAVVLFQSGATVDQLKGAGFALRELQGACFSATRLWDAGASGQVFKVCGWSAAVLKDACWSAQKLSSDGYVASDLKGGGFGASDRLCEDTVGFGWTAIMWWIQNCKYNAVHDVHRLKLDSKHALEALDTGVESYVGVRQKLARDSPDLVFYQIVFRTELNMVIVMPSVIKHTQKWSYLSMTRFETGSWPYLSMIRFETGSGGNPHLHGFSWGKKPPRMPRRVKAKQVVGGDEAVSFCLVNRGVVRHTSVIWGLVKGL